MTTEPTPLVDPEASDTILELAFGSAIESHNYKSAWQIAYAVGHRSARLAAREEAAKVADEHARDCAMARSNANAMNDRKAAANADAERLGAELIATAIRALSNKGGEGSGGPRVEQTLGQYAALRSAQHALDIIARKIGARNEISELAIEESNRIEQAIIALDGCWPFAASNKGGRDGE